MGLVFSSASANEEGEDCCSICESKFRWKKHAGSEELYRKTWGNLTVCSRECSKKARERLGGAYLLFND